MTVRNRGFTLIELMIVVVILGVIVAIAYPSYTRWAMQTRRSDAHRVLTTIAALQEKRLSECAAYTTSFTGNITDCIAGGLGITSTSPDGHYVVTLTSSSSTEFSLSAAPVTGGLQLQDTKCLPGITLNSLGLKGPANCW
jgi:type IV pilus assembly protein PilE